MEKRFEFSPNPTKKLLEFKVWGFWEDMGEFKEFEKEFKANIRKMSAAENEWYAIVNLEDYPPQPKEIQEGHKRNMQFAVRHGMKKAAHVMGSILTNQQLQRLADSVDKTKWRYFRTREEAMDWLYSD